MQLLKPDSPISICNSCPSQQPSPPHTSKRISACLYILSSVIFTCPCSLLPGVSTPDFVSIRNLSLLSHSIATRFSNEREIIVLEFINSGHAPLWFKNLLFVSHCSTTKSKLLKRSLFPFFLYSLYWNCQFPIDAISFTFSQWVLPSLSCFLCLEQPPPPT